MGGKVIDKPMVGLASLCVRAPQALRRTSTRRVLWPHEPLTVFSIHRDKE